MQIMKKNLRDKRYGRQKVVLAADDTQSYP